MRMVITSARLYVLVLLAVASIAHAATPAVTVPGVVTDESGNPLEGVTVQVHGVRSFDNADNTGLLPSWTTDNQGCFGIPLRANVLSYDLWFEKRGYAPMFLYGISAKSMALRLVLKKGVVVTGTVSSIIEGREKPVELAHVLLTGPSTSVHYHQESFTDNEGRYMFRATPAPAGKKWSVVFLNEKVGITIGDGATVSGPDFVATLKVKEKKEPIPLSVTAARAADIQYTNVTQLLAAPTCHAVVEKLDFGVMWLKADDGKTICVGPATVRSSLFNYIQTVRKGEKCSLPADFETYLEQYSEETESVVTQICAQIKAEALALGSDHWAGEYEATCGPQWSRALFVAPKAGCAFISVGCMGLHGQGRYDRNYGEATYVDGHIRLSFKYRNTREGYAGIAEDLIPVPWGERQYLIPSEEMISFCNRVNGGMEPRIPLTDDGHAFLRRGDDRRKVSGMPQVPQEYRKYLLATPVEADLVTVGTYTDGWNAEALYEVAKASATIDSGSVSGLLPGMRLHAKQPKEAHESWITLTAVGLKSSRGILTTAEASSTTPKPGQRFSTQLHSR